MSWTPTRTGTARPRSTPGGAARQGPYARPTGIDPAQQRAVVWAGFRPGGAYPFFPVPAWAVRNRHVPLEAVCGRDGAVLRERLLEAGSPRAILDTLEAVLLSSARRPLELDPTIRRT
jgi:hypothetical protein